MKARGGWLLAPLLLTGCMLGPDYRRPPVPAPPQFRGAPATSEPSIAETKWADLFEDDKLHQLVATALEHNFDLNIASERVEEARARFQISRSVNTFAADMAAPGRREV